MGEHADKYGKYYWGVVRPYGKDIMLYADEVRIGPGGTLILSQRRKDDPEAANLIIAAGQWEACYAASTLDGAPVAVDHYWEWEASPWDPQPSKEISGARRDRR